MSKFITAGLMLILPATLWGAEPHYDVSARVWTKKYDSLFKRYTEDLFEGDVSWKLFKLQAIAESGLRREVQHKSGATGLMQIMPVTFKEIRKNSPELNGKSLYSAKWNILAGITYSRYLYERWGKNFEGNDQIALMLASYNAGYSRTLKAVSRARKSQGYSDVHWQDISRYVPRSTRSYVSRILSSIPDRGITQIRVESLPELQPQDHIQTAKVDVERTIDPIPTSSYSVGIGSIVEWMHALPVEDYSEGYAVE